MMAWNSQNGRYPWCRHGDSCWLVVVGDDISPSTSAHVHALRRAMEALHPAWLVETVPGYCTLGLIVQPLRVSLEEVKELVSTASENCRAIAPVQPRTVTIPVCYGGDVRSGHGYRLPAFGTERAGGRAATRRSQLPVLHAGVSARLPLPHGPRPTVGNAPPRNAANNRSGRQRGDSRCTDRRLPGVQPGRLEHHRPNASRLVRPLA